MAESLGSFGVVREVVDFEFDYFGDTIRVNPELGEDVILELGAAAAGLDDKTGLAEIIALRRRMVAAVVHPEDVDTVMSSVRHHRQTTEDVMSMVQQIVEKVTAYPTAQPSSSSDGQLRTAERSEGDSSSRAQHKLEAKGRPDLALMVLEAREFASA